jgi:hypothetical protein
MLDPRPRSALGSSIQDSLDHGSHILGARRPVLLASSKQLERLWLCFLAVADGEQAHGGNEACWIFAKEVPTLVVIEGFAEICPCDVLPPESGLGTLGESALGLVEQLGTSTACDCQEVAAQLLSSGHPWVGCLPIQDGEVQQDLERCLAICKHRAAANCSSPFRSAAIASWSFIEPLVVIAPLVVVTRQRTEGPHVRCSASFSSTLSRRRTNSACASNSGDHGLKRLARRSRSKLSVTSIHDENAGSSRSTSKSNTLPSCLIILPK